jgi:serine/threonine protein kinase
MNNDNNTINVGEPHSNDSPPSSVPTEYDEIELINQGSFGCVFRPNIPCEKSQAPNKKYISKIQLNDENITNEFAIGEQLQTIPLYYLHYSPILSKCVVSIQSLNKEQVEKCDILKNYNESSPQTSPQSSPQTSPPPQPPSLISTKIKYVGNKNIEEYLWSVPSSTFKSKVLYCFYYVLQSIHKMNEKGIIHYDIKEKNIMYDEYIQAPLLIDFGLSFIPESIKESSIPNLLESNPPKPTPPGPTPPSTIFYTKRVYPYWCIEIFILSYTINRIKEESYEIVDENNNPQVIHLKPTDFDKANSNVTETKIDELLRTYKTEIENFFKEYMKTQFSQSKIDTCIESMKTYLMDFNGTSWSENVFTKLFVQDIYNTWDIYSLAITFACILDKNLTEENMEEYQPFLDLLHSILFSIPTERPNYDKIMEIFATL